jgi:hypothetical protein
MLAGLGACAGEGTSLLAGSDPQQAAPAVAAAPAEAAPTADPGKGPYTASQITAIVSGRSWRYEYPQRQLRGIITYNADGTLIYDEEGKGRGTGKWWAGDYTLCESRYPTPFLPEGRLDDCSGFRRAGSHYYLGGARLTEVTP